VIRVTPAYELCLLISCSLGNIKAVDALKDVGIMLLLLLVVILFPELVLFLPRLITPPFL
jgi:TRAP-type C4-dicarboxylate transport system permease large subunit